MKDKYFSLLNKTVSKAKIRKNAETIHDLEGNESYSNYKTSTDYCIKMLKEAGFEQIERIALPSDGKTTYFDCIMPQAWETTGRSFIRLEDKAMTMDERMIADSDKDPFNAGIWGAPTPEGGIDCEIVDFRSTGPDKKAIKGKLMLMDGFTLSQYRFAAESGVAGVIISDSKATEDYPDHCRWSNAIGFTGWYSTAEDKRIPIFSITPRRCEFLRKRLAAGKLTAHAEAKCRIYDGEIYTVTGLIPGETAEEIAMVAHMYEPFLPDDAAGGAVIAEICRALKKLTGQGELPPLKRGLRIVLCMERYGFHQYFLDRQRNKNTRMLFSFDSCCHFPGGKDQPQLRLRLSTMLQPTFMDLYLPELLRSVLPQRSFIREKGNLSDDTFCSDNEIGIPSMWLHTANLSRYHHNCGHDFMDADWDLAGDVAAVMGTVIGKLAAGDRAVYRRMLKTCEESAMMNLVDKCTIIQYECVEGKLSARDAAEKVRYQADKLLKQLTSISRFCPVEVSEEVIQEIKDFSRYAAKSFRAPKGPRELFGSEAAAARTIVTRLLPGTLMSMARVPHAKRHKVNIPELLYVLFDGKRSVFDAVKLYEYENDAAFSEQQFKTLLTDLDYLAEYGYVKLAVK